MEFAYNNGIRMALESFCYPPFIFNGLHDFMQFVSCFPQTRLGAVIIALASYIALSVFDVLNIWLFAGFLPYKGEVG